MAIDAETLKSLDHRRLQALAKEYGIKANQKKGDIITQISKISQEFPRWALCSRLRLLLVRVPGFSAYFDLYPIGQVKGPKIRAAEAQQIWNILTLGIPLCYLFNLLPDQPDITDVDTDPAKVDVDDVAAHRVATERFLAALRGMPDSSVWISPLFEVSDLHCGEDNPDPGSTIKVLKAVIQFVEILPCLGRNHHIHDLPVELLSRIFDLLASPEVEESVVPIRHLLLVCRRWYSVATQNGKLWTNIHIGQPLKDKSGKQTTSAVRTALYVERSQGRDLSVVFDPEKSVLRRPFDPRDYLSDGVARITRFTILKRRHNEYYDVLAQIRATHSMPRLHTLVLTQAEFTDRREYQLVTHPCLQVIQTRDVCLTWPGSVGPFPNLRILDLLEGRCWHFQYCQDFAASLHALPLLERMAITIQGVAYPRYSSDLTFTGIPRATLPKLAKLELKGHDTYILHCFLHFIDAPRLRRLYLVGMPKDDRSTDWGEVKLECSALEYLTMHRIRSSSTLFRKLAPPPTTIVDVYICHDTQAEYVALEKISSTQNLLCQSLNWEWGCGHLACATPLDATETPKEAVRWRTHTSPKYLDPRENTTSL